MEVRCRNPLGRGYTLMTDALQEPKGRATTSNNMVAHLSYEKLPSALPPAGKTVAHEKRMHWNCVAMQSARKIIFW